MIDVAVYRRIKQMSYKDFDAWCRAFYREAFTAGLREGEKEFDDAAIYTEDELRRVFGNEAAEKLLEGGNL